jgi:hypothetical protein
MKRLILISSITSLILIIWKPLFSQSTWHYPYQQLSHQYYIKTIDSLKKEWVCPIVFSDKEPQKLFKETFDSRTAFLTSAFNARAYLYDAQIISYLEGIIAELKKNSPELYEAKPLILIDRSAAVNAYAMGDGILSVNLGLLNFVQSREELALILAHELGHNLMKHSFNAMYARAEWFTSDKYKDLVKSVLDSEYERYTRLKKIVENVKFDRTRHQRYNEKEADSLAVAVIKKANFTFYPSFFLRLDSADLVYRNPLSKPIAQYFNALGADFDSSWTKSKSRGLSVKAYNFSENKAIQDSLKTHPDCIERYNVYKEQANPGQLNPIPADIKDKVVRGLIWNMFDDRRITACIYRTLLEKDRGKLDPWYDFMLFNSVAILYLMDQKLERFLGIAVKPKEFISEDYFKLQTALEQIPREQLKDLAKNIYNAPFRSRLSPEEGALMALINTLALTDEVDEKEKALALKKFNQDYPNSMYREFSEFFKK